MPINNERTPAGNRCCFNVESILLNQHSDIDSMINQYWVPAGTLTIAQDKQQQQYICAWYT